MNGDPESAGPASEPGRREVSDLIGAGVTLALIVWFLLMLVGFFFVGPLVGLLMLGAGVIGFGWALVSVVRRADTSE